MAQLNIFCFLSTYTTEHITLQKTHLRSPTIKSLGWIDKFTRARHPYYTYNILQCPFCPGFLFQIKLLWPETATVCCGHRPQHLRYQREAIFGQRPPQFIVAKGHNTWNVTKLGQYDHQQHSVLGLYTHLAGYSYGDHIVSICYSKPNIHGQRPQFVAAWRYQRSLWQKATAFKNS